MDTRSDGSPSGSTFDRRGEGWIGQIDPRTRRWAPRARWGFGILAVMPLALLIVGGTLALLDVMVPGHHVLTDLAAMTLYMHFATQFLVLAIFGKLLLEHDEITATGRLWWGVFFLVLAPVAVFAYWIVHVMAEPRRSHITVREMAQPLPPRDMLAEAGIR
jgi:hypothetical protein